MNLFQTLISKFKKKELKEEIKEESIPVVKVIPKEMDELEPEPKPVKKTKK